MPWLLIVTDDRSDGAMVALMIERVSYEVVDADNELDALQILEKAPKIDGVLVGMELAKKGDFSFLDKLREYYPSLPVIMIGGIYHPDWFAEAQEKGAVDYLYKPKSPEGIKKAVDVALKR